MHQQIRVSLGRIQTSDGPGAMASVATEYDPLTVPPGALVTLLERLAEGGFNLRMAGGSRIEHGGEFIFAVDDDRTDACVEFLTDEGYKPRKLELHHCDLADRPGELARCLKELESDREVNEIFVGTPEPDGRIPIQVSTVSHAAAESGTSQSHPHHHT